MTVGERIKQTRTSLGLSRGNLAREAGIPYSTLASLENGGAHSSTSIAVIAAVLGVDPLWLSSGRGKSQVDHTSSLLPADERKLLTAFRKLSLTDKRIILRVANGLAEVSPNYSFQRTPVHRSRSYKRCGAGAAKFRR